LNRLLRAVEQGYLDVLAQSPERPPVLDRIYSEHDISTERLLVRITFHAGADGLIRSRCHQFNRRDLDELGCCYLNVNEFERDIRSLYSRMYEDHLMEMELRPRREAVDELVRRAANTDVIQAAMANLRQIEDHVRRNHHYARDLRGSMRELPFDGYSHLDRPCNRQSFNWGIVSSTVEPIPYDPPREQSRIMLGEPIAYHQAMLGLLAELFSGEVGTPAAQAKGLELLKSWLTPEQLASYEKTKSFEVIGSDTKKRYRIKHGRQMNIEEIDANGKRVRGLCALPEGGVVAGDCVLAQKLALETNEKQFLSVANKFA
jgi:hypothetical protein